jgi:hypothetical protein
MFLEDLDASRRNVQHPQHSNAPTTFTALSPV